MEILKGKTALITGAGKGIGRAIAFAFAQEGVNLALTARTIKDLEQVAVEAKTINPEIHIACVAADVSDNSSVVSAVETLNKELGAIDILVNNAGIAKFGSFMDLSVEDWEGMIKTNLFGAYYMIRAVLPQMKQNKKGDIVNISSTAGLKGASLTSAYSASKFGLIGLSESLMQEVRKENIRVLTMTPSTIATEMAINLQLTNGNPETVMQPEDIAEIIVSNLKLSRRVLVKDINIFSTNP